jgi:mRNA interferase MazF
VIVVSHEAFNEVPNWRSVIVVPVSTSSSQAARGPTVIRLPAGAGGLERDSVALCHQVTTLDRARLSARIGVLDPELLSQVGEGLRIAQDLR